ncbi:MAG: 4-hydroxy-tetrahydrodipicolinate reductase [Deltaproteobacteria bacterium]|nr:4-hydroxy-tetrahydrodipicolinate reductase [Deltaproteobacteria bacterium]
MDRLSGRHRVAGPHRIAIAGATGRMGRAVARLAPEHHCTIVGALAAPADRGQVVEGVTVVSDPTEAIENAEVVIDFSHPGAVVALAQACRARAIPMVSGTTNLPDDAQRALEELAKVAPMMWAPNMSLGVQLLAEIVEQAVRRLGVGFDIEIVETHHNKKIDAPSGTAKRLIDAVRAGALSDEPLRHGRVGDVGARPRGEIGVHAIRGGDVIGDHTVHLLGKGERIELTHRATSRDLFAHGALRAASFLLGRAPGRYAIKDLLGG